MRKQRETLALLLVVTAPCCAKRLSRHKFGIQSREHMLPPAFSAQAVRLPLRPRAHAMHSLHVLTPAPLRLARLDPMIASASPRRPRSDLPPKLASSSASRVAPPVLHARFLLAALRSRCGLSVRTWPSSLLSSDLCQPLRTRVLL